MLDHQGNSNSVSSAISRNEISGSRLFGPLLSVGLAVAHTLGWSSDAIAQNKPVDSSSCAAVKEPSKIVKSFLDDIKITPEEDDLDGKRSFRGVSQVPRFDNEMLREARALLSPEDFYILVSLSVETPEELHRILDILIAHPEKTEKVSAFNVEEKAEIIKAQEIDLLVTPQTTLFKGWGDCDNRALVFREILKDLGCRNKIDYQPKIITVSKTEHAICIFKGTDGKQYASEPGKEITAFSDIFKASPVFQKVKKKKKEKEVFEIDLFNGNRVISSIDSKSFCSDNDLIIIQIAGGDFHDSHARNYLPVGWEKYKDVIFSFTKSDTYARFIPGSGKLEYLKSSPKKKK